MNLKFLYGLKENLEKVAVVNGQVLICTNSGEMFVDINDTRFEIADTDEIKRKLLTIAEGATKVEASEQNGYIKINGVETKVYELPTLKAENISDFAAAVKAVKVDAAVTADKVAHKLTVKVGGANVEFDGSAAQTADVDAAIEAAINAIPEQTDYTVTCTDADVEAAEGVPAFKRHTLTQNGKTICTIDVPKDLVIQSGRVENDKLILVLNDAANTEIEINVGDLIEYVTSGSADGDMVYVNIDENHKVTATITDGTITLAKLAQEVKDAIAEAKAKDGAGNVIVDTYAQKATTLEGYGITDAYTKDETAELDAVVLAEAQKYADEKVTSLVDGDIAAIKEALTWGTF